MLSRVSTLLPKVPLTLVLIVVTFVAGVVAGTVYQNVYPRLMQSFGWNLPALREGRLYALWIGLPFASSPGLLHVPLAALLIGVGPLEYLYGTRVAGVGFFVLGPLSSILTVLLLWPLDVFGVAWVRPFLYPPDMGSSSASILCWGLVLSSARGRWQSSLLVGTFVTLLLFLLLLPKTYGMDHMIAFLLGVSVGTVHLLGRRAPVMVRRA